MKRNLACVVVAFGLLTSSAFGAMARISVLTTDLSGTPISSVAVGEEFLVNVMVQDVRDTELETRGVFMSSLDLQFDQPVVAIDPDDSPTWGPTFANPAGASSGELSTGLIEGITAFTQSISPPGADAQLFLQYTATATSAGLASFAPMFDDTFGHDVLLYGEDAPIAASEIDFVGTNLSVVPEPSSLLLLSVFSSVLAWVGQRARRQRG